jgi:hypothetical protein
MQQCKALGTSRLAVIIGGAVLALSVVWPLLGAAHANCAKAKATTTQTRHTDKPPAGDQDLASQVAELQIKVARLEAALQKSAAGMGGKKPTVGMTEDDMGEMGSLQPGQDAPAAVGMGGGEMGMKLDKLMGMMEKMMSGMEGGAMQPAGGAAAMGGTGGGEMGMKLDKLMGMMGKMMSGMGGGSMQPAGGAAGMGGTGGAEMGMKLDKLMRMMEKMMSGIGGGPMQPEGGAAGMGGTGGGEMGMKLDKLMRMMEKMMSGMGGGAMQPGQGMPAAGGMQDM